MTKKNLHEDSHAQEIAVESRPYETLKNKDLSKILIAGFVALLVLIAGTIWFLSKNKKDKEQNYVSNGLIQNNDPVYGNKNSQLKMVIIEDYFCPHCRDDNPVFDKAEEKYADQAQFVYKPIQVIAGSQDVIPYALAAGQQGKFKEFTTKAFERNSELYGARRSTMQSIAKSISGLNYDKWYEEGTNNLELRKKGEQNKKDLNKFVLPKSGNQEEKPSGRDFPGTPGVILMVGDEVKAWWSGSIPGDTKNSNERLKVLEGLMKNAWGEKFEIKN